MMIFYDYKGSKVLYVRLQQISEKSSYFLLIPQDVDDFFEHERTFLLEYHNRVKDASAKSDRMTRSHKSAADDYNRIGSSLYALGTQDSTDICK